MFKMKDKAKSTRYWATFAFILSFILLAFSLSLGAETSGDGQIAPLNHQFLNYHHRQPDLSMSTGQSLLYQRIYQQRPELLSRQKSSNGRLLGYRPSPFDTSYLSRLATAQELSLSPQLQLKQSYPVAYDLRTLGKVTPVKDQGNCGSCWAFGTYGSMESCLLPAENRDFSENNLKDTHGFDWTWDEGGNAFISAAYLTRWSGPIDETDDPYNDSSGVSPTGLTVQEHIQKIIQVPDRNANAIKNAIMTYGGVATSMCWDAGPDSYPDLFFGTDVFNDATDAYWNYLYDDWMYGAGLNHMVTIVGWDDNYSKTNFIPCPSNNYGYKAGYPAGNGAWIVKNSWGTGWGDQGYFYVSYYDQNFARELFVFLNAEPTDNYQHQYEYDPFGLVLSYGFSSNTAWAANVFTPTANEPLAAVAFYALAPNTQYSINVYTNVDISTNNPTKGTKVTAASTSGTVANAGYYTIKLPAPVQLISGQKFSVVVKLTTPGYNYPIPIEARQIGLGDYYPDLNYTSHAVSNPGESFYSTTGTAWYDFYNKSYTVKDDDNQPAVSLDHYNVCLKAFTRTMPIITLQPVSRTVDAETDTTFAVTVFDTIGASYQWYYEGMPIGANSATLTLNNVSPANNGDYYVVITNASGTATSEKATLIVRPLLPQPMLDLEPGTYSTPQNVSAFYPPEYTGVTMRYTINGTTEPTITSPVFSQTVPLKISKTTTLKVRAFKTGYTASHSASAAYTITGIVATPTFSLPAGTYLYQPTITLKCATPQAVIHYTTDGSEPTDQSPSGTTVPLTGDTVLKAKAFLDSWESSATATAAYVLTTIAEPTFSLAGDTYGKSQTVTIKCSTPGVSIIYTTDNSDPVVPTAGNKGHGTIGTIVKITADCTLKAIAYKAKFTSSAIASATYNIGTVATPAFDKATLPATYTKDAVIKLNCATSGANIRYTTDGSTPTETTSTSYDSAAGIVLDRPMTIKAKAFKDKRVSSTVLSGVFNVFTPDRPSFDIPGNPAPAVPYTTEQPVTIKCDDATATIRYTTNGAEPTATSTAIASGGALQIGGPKTVLKAKAFKSGWAPSVTTSATYVINTKGTVVVPVLKYTPAAYPNEQSVSITCSTAGATIRYTTDGTTPTGLSDPYTGPVTFAGPKVIKAKAFKDNMKSSTVVTGSYTAALPQPVFDPTGGTYGEQTVTITCAVAGATIRYTTDGKTTPAATSPVAVNGKVLVNKSMTIKAKAFMKDWAASPVQSATYTINQAATPTFSIAEGSYTKAQKVIMKCATTGAVIHYTTNGADPTAASPVAPAAGITVSATTTLKAIAVKTGLTDSNIKTATYTITGTVATPTFYCIGKDIRNLALTSSGTYATGLKVTVSCATPEATIHYTVNGKEPTVNDPAVDSGSDVTIESTTTLKAKAFKDTWTPSATKTEIYTVMQAATPAINITDSIATISCATPGAVIRYTINGVDPGLSDKITASGSPLPITITGTTIIKAKAWKTGLAPSKVALAKMQYELTIADDINGNTNLTGTITVNHGASETITATPAVDYHFVKWSQTAGAGTAVFGNPNSAATTVRVFGGDATIKANFAVNTITLTNNGNGTTDPSGSVAVNPGASTSISATPNIGYRFVNWAQTGGSGTAVFGDEHAANTTVTVTGGNVTIQANFVGYQTLTVVNDGNGTTTPSGPVQLDNGVSRIVTATPNVNQQFLNWTKISGSGTATFGDVNSASTPVTVTGGDATIRANFTLMFRNWVTGNLNAGESHWYCFKAIKGYTYSISWDDSYQGSDNYSLDVKVSAYRKDLSTAYFIGADSGYNTPKTITAIDNFVYLKVEGYFSDESGTFAIKVDPPIYTLTINNNGGGSTSPNGAKTVCIGDCIPIKATPGVGCRFVNWTKTAGAGTVVFGNATSAETTVTITGGNATIQANFSIDHTVPLNLTIISDGNGSTSPSCQVYNGVSKSITATPNVGCLFACWTKTAGTGTVKFGNTTSANTTVTVTGGDATIRANFATSTTGYMALGSSAVSLDSFNGKKIYSMVTAQPTTKPEANASPSTLYSYTLSSTGVTPSYSSSINVGEDGSQRSVNLVYSAKMTDWDNILRQQENESLAKRFKQLDKTASGINAAAPANPVVGTAWNNVYITVTGKYINTTCKYISSRAYFFVDNRDNMSTYLAGYGRSFDTIYNMDASKFGDVNDVDHNGKVIIIFSRELSGGLLGYFYAVDKYPKTTYSYSNEGDIFYVTTTTAYQGNVVKGTLAHELQHMIYFDQHYNRGVTSTYTWLNEALSQAAEYYNGFLENHNAWMNDFLKNWGGLSLTHWTSSNYGYGAIFIRYLIDQYGDTAIKNMCATDKVGVQAVEAATGVDFNVIFNNFTRALVMSGTGDCTNPLYKFTTLNLQTLQSDGRGGLLFGDTYNAGDSFSGSLYPYRLYFAAWSGTFGDMTLTGTNVVGTACGLSR